MVIKMETKKLESFLQNRFFALPAVIAAVYFFLKFLSPLVGPVLTAVLFVTIFGPLLKRMQKSLHIPRQAGAVLLLAAGSSLLLALLWIFFSWGVGSLPEWMGRLEKWEEGLTKGILELCSVLGEALGIDGAYLGALLSDRLGRGIASLKEKAGPEIFTQSFAYMKGLAAAGGFFATFLIAVVLLAKDYDQVMNRLLDQEKYHMLLEILCGIIRYIATFVKAQLVIMSAISTLCGAVLWIIGVEKGFLWGLLAGLLDALPFIGTGIVLIPIAGVEIFHGKLGTALLVLCLYGACALLRELLEPKLIGRKMGIPAIAVLVSVYAGIRLFGLTGILKGPLGYVMVQQIWEKLPRYAESQSGEI